MSDISSIRKDYTHKSLIESDISADPIQQFQVWWNEAVQAKIPEVNAMTLATASSDGIPSARIVLLKEFSERGFVFFTNYNSYKSAQLLENPKACLVFFWKEQERQVRITGIVQKTGIKESETYFHSRPEASQVSAAVSPQSQVVESREWLENEYTKMENECKGKQVPHPQHWGGFVVKPVIIEFWQGRPGRLHDRIQYSLKKMQAGKIERLAP